MDSNRFQPLPILRRLLDDPEPPGLDPAAPPESDGWDEPLDPGDDGQGTASLLLGSWPEAQAVTPAEAPTPADDPVARWGTLAAPLADAAAALARLDARWEDLRPPVREGLEARVCWREGVLAAFADLPGLRREALPLWLWKEGLAPTPSMDRRRWEEGLDDAEALHMARGLAAGLGAATRAGGEHAFEPANGARILSELGAFRRLVRPVFDATAPVEILPRPGFDATAWARWAEAAMRDDLPPLAAWAESAWQWRSSAAVANPALAEAWIMGTHLLRARGTVRAAPLPLWAGLGRRRQLAASADGDPQAHAAALLLGVAAAARDHLRLLDGLRARDEAAREWISDRRAGGLAAGLWELLVSRPAIAAVPAAKALGAAPRATTRVLLAMRAAGLVREVSGREAWRVWAAAGV